MSYQPLSDATVGDVSVTLTVTAPKFKLLNIEWFDGVLRDILIEFPKLEGIVGRTGLQRYVFTVHRPGDVRTFKYDIPKLDKPNLERVLKEIAFKVLAQFNRDYAEAHLNWCKHSILYIYERGEPVTAIFFSIFLCGACITCCCKDWFINLKPTVLSSQDIALISQTADEILRREL